MSVQSPTAVSLAVSPSVQQSFSADLIKSITKQNALDIFKIKEKDKTLLHNCHLWSEDAIREKFVNTLSPEKRVEVLSSVDKNGYTPIHSFVVACRAKETNLLLELAEKADKNSQDMLKIFIDKLAPEDYIALMKKPNEDGIIPLQYACSKRDNFACCKLLVEKTPQDQRRAIIRFGNEGDTALDTAKALRANAELVTYLEAQ